MRRVLLVAQFVPLILIFAAASAASPGDDASVLGGYRKLYNGDADGARQEFDRILAARPGDLAARFGNLTVSARRIRDDRAEAPQFERALDAFINDAEARHDRGGDDAEALFYLANAYMMRARYRLDYDKGMWGAARDGARSKKLAETYIKRYPAHGDAYFALGAYNYYVELAPAFVRVIRLLMFLPSGNRLEGLRQLERAYSEGSLFAPQAGLLLVEIYGTFESRPADGVRVGERLAREYPDNPTIQFTLAELYASPAVEDPERAAERYEAVMLGEERRPGVARPAAFHARLGVAASRIEQWRLDGAISLLTATIEARPASPPWVIPTFLLRRANYRALQGDMPGAKADVGRVLAEPAWKDHQKSATELNAWINRFQQSGEAAVYAALVTPNRLAFDRRWNEASAAYDAVRARFPDHPQVRFRIAQMAFRKGDMPGLEHEFAAVADAKGAPDWLRAAALLQLGRVHDVTGRRTDAKAAYKRIVDDYEREGASWPAKVGLVTPYQRRK